MKDKKKIRLKQKMFILAIGIVILIGLVVFNQYKTAKDREEYQEILKLREQEKEDKEKEDKEKEEENGSAYEDEEAEEGEEEQDQTITITNLQEIATPVMGNYDKDLEVRLSEYVIEQDLSAKSAKILQAVVPEDDPQTTEFYTQVDDKSHSIVKLVWHSKERVVTASECSLTEEEIETLARGDNGPNVRDITAEEEEKLSKEQEVTDESEGEN